MNRHLSIIRLFDILASAVGLILLSPLFLIVAAWIKIEDPKGPLFFKQIRVGKDGVDFWLLKFRSMYVNSDRGGLITIGRHDPRITHCGYYIRKFKVDELPQLINVLSGDMSLVGPRPEVRKYVDLYTEEQRHVLDVRPGITDYASIEYLDENALLALSDDPDKTYVEEIMPAKIKLNMKYIRNQSVEEYFFIIWQTVKHIAVGKWGFWYLTKSSLPYWCVMILDMCICALSIIVSYAVLNGPADLVGNFWKIMLAVCAYLPIFMVSEKLFHAYNIQYRYTSFTDLFRIGKGMMAFVLLVYTIRQIWDVDSYIWPISTKVIIMAALLSALVIMMMRIIIKNIYDHKSLELNVPRAVIYGTPANVELLALAMQNMPDRPYRIYGFITEDEMVSNQFIIGKRAFLKNDKTVEMLIQKNIEAVICAPAIGKKIMDDSDFINQLTNAHIDLMTVPDIMPMVKNVSGAFEKVPLKKIEIEDLLPRVEIEVDMDAIGQLLKDKTVLITGAAGSIGSEMVKQIANFQPKMMLLVDQAESPLHAVMLMMQADYPKQAFVPLVSSITKQLQMEELFKTYRPDYVFHAAAYKHVPMMEISPANAIQNNCLGTRIMADLAVKYGVKKFVMISTDKAVNPTNVMGCSKRICEIYCQSLNNCVNQNVNQNESTHCTQFVTTRFGNVLGSNGSVIPIFKKQIKMGGPVTVTHPDIVRYFMLIPEACKLVLQAGTMGNGGEIYAFDMGKPVKIADLAKRMIELSGAKDVKIEYVGLRDGEKLYEEVLNEKENTIETDHPKIRVAKVREYDYDIVKKNELELEAISESFDEMAIVRKMKEIVPEFKSQHSRFETLDKAI